MKLNTEATVITVVKIFAFLVLIASLQLQTVGAEAKPSFRQDLERWGYVTGISEYSSLAFLSNNLLLVAINQREFRGGSEPLSAVLTGDQPPSSLVVFDLNKKEASRRALMLVMKAPGSIVSLSSGNFLAFSKSEARVCSPELTCEKPFPTNGVIPPIDSDMVKLLHAGQNLDLRVSNASSSGKRVVTNELSSTTWHKITHPLAIDEPSPDNFRRVTVYDNQSSKSLLSIHYNPRGQVVDPAISPDGTKLAIVVGGVLEVYDMPSEHGSSH